MRFLLCFLLCSTLAWPQSKSKSVKTASVADAVPTEDAELEAELAEAGSSQVEYARILERHLRKYPNTAKRADLERILLQAGIDLRDNTRILRYGPSVIDAGANNPLYLDHVSRALLERADVESNERALRYAKELENDLNGRIAGLRMPGSVTAGRGRRLDETEYASSRAILFQARALGNLGRIDEALVAAQRAYQVCPSMEAARERSKWLEKKGDLTAAFSAAADAFTVIDSRATQSERDEDRKRMSALAARLQLDEAQAGREVLQAWDRNRNLTEERRARILAFDPNAGARDILDYKLSGLDGRNLELAGLKGKVVVFDFWATWCGPCRAQHPLYARVKERFKQNPDVVFLAVSTDEDRSRVSPFLEAQKWSKEVWFDDGLGSHLRITSIPTTVVLDRNGEVYSRLNGFIQDRFVDMLSVRIREALGE